MVPAAGNLDSDQRIPRVENDVCIAPPIESEQPQQDPDHRRFDNQEEQFESPDRAEHQERNRMNHLEHWRVNRSNILVIDA